MQTRVILLAIATILVAGIFATAGALLLVRPEAFLKFYDFLNPGMRWSTKAEWRRDVRSGEWKAVGVGFLIVGVFFILVAFLRLLSNSQIQ